jgi:hypothetical protein
MEKKQTEKPSVAAPKSFLTVGPTLHYSHENVQHAWLLAVIAFCGCCVCWSKILTGAFDVLDIDIISNVKLWTLGQYTTSGASIFEYPWQIVVLGLLLGSLVVIPVLISQLMSFNYSIPFVIALGLLANLPGLAISVLLSCFAVASRPLRFRSRFISIALCTAPQIVYLGLFGGISSDDPIRWGFSYTPWLCAWLTGITMAGIVLGIGHYTRYKPGLVWIVTALTLGLAVTIFDGRIGFDELDYQLYVAKNNPEQFTEFHTHRITESLDKTITNPDVKKYLEDFFFYPTDPIALRKKLKDEILLKLSSQDRWPSWFAVPDEFKYQAKRQKLADQYELFIRLRPRSKRMPIALFYHGLLSEYSPDLRELELNELLTFYNDYPHERSLDIWHDLYQDFGESAESIEARWRIARDWAGKGQFQRAEKLLAEACDMVQQARKEIVNKRASGSTFLESFAPPAETAMTEFKLIGLERRINQLRALIGEENRMNKNGTEERLSRFVMLNPHSLYYAARLDELLEEIDNEDPLVDNVLLAQIKLVADDQLRAKNLEDIHNKYPETDGGVQAFYELGLLKISFWRGQDEANKEQKKKSLAEAHAILNKFLVIYPEQACTEQVRRNLAALPSVD